ncbi:MAG: trehalase family glycosidase [Planctomycetota bacterium]|nr:trehalase family glycosidase [Planctomycetota bacterium]
MDWIDRNRRTVPHRRLVSRDTTTDDRGESVENLQLYYFADCGSSGMDDSPRTPRVPEAGQFYDWIDLSSQMALSFKILGRMYDVLGNAELASHWEDRAVELGDLINAELWCERTRFYYDRMLPKNFVASKTAASFWPMLAGICLEDRTGALVEHLLDEREFNRHTPVPTLSADDPNYSPKGTYWYGGVWAPTNYMITRGLMKAGRSDVAHEIAMKYVGVLARTFAGYHPNTM